MSYTPRAIDRERLDRMTDTAVLREYQDMRKASFGMFANNAKRRGNACVEELAQRGITMEPSIFGATPLKGWE